MKGLAALTAALGTLLLSGCPTTSPLVPAHSADVIAFNVSQEPHSLNPLLTQSDDEQQLAHLMFDLLLDVDPSGRQIPALAAVVPSPANGGVSRDGRTIIYRLRRGVFWQDGKPFTSRDVWFTWRAIVAPANNVRSTRGYDLITAIGTPDPYTAVVRLRRAWAPALATLFTYGTTPMPIIPAHLFSGPGVMQQSPFNLHPVGTGPYRLKTWTRGERLVFEANPRYFRGPPRTKTLVAQVVPDVNTDLTLLRTGQLDWSLLSPAQRLSLGKVEGLHFVYAPLGGFGALVFNCRRPPFDDLRMRRAIAMAIDRARLSASITRGQYPTVDSDQPPYSWAYDPGARVPAYDPAGADAALEALGWRRGPDGLRTKRGQPLSLVLAVFPEGDTAVRTSIFAQEMLRARGVAVSIKRVTLTHFYLPASEGGLLMSGRFDLAYFAWRMGEDPDDSDIVSCRGVSNYAGYCNSALDRLEAQALATLNGRIRKALYSRIQQILAADVPYDFLYAPRYGFAAVNALRNFRPTPLSPTWNSYDWYKTR